MSLVEYGTPIYLEIHRRYNSGPSHMSFGVMTGKIEDFTLAEMQEFRQTLCVVIGICEEAFRRGNEKRYPCAQTDQPVRAIAEELRKEGK